MSNTNAIERIKGYCCEVTPEQWRELVKVADEVGHPVWSHSRIEKNFRDYHYVLTNSTDDELILTYQTEGRELIPFPDFLAKLRGDAETWTPKAGEDVWFRFHATGAKHRGVFITRWNGKDIIWDIDSQSPVVAFGPIENVPHYTRAEAEKKFNIVITDNP